MMRKKIPGSKYALCLEDDQNQWFFRLRIHNAIEEEIPLTHLDKKAIRSNIVTLVEAAHLSLNEIQIDLLLGEFWDYVHSKISEKEQEISEKAELIRDARFGELVERIEKLSENATNLEKRITRFEAKYT